MNLNISTEEYEKLLEMKNECKKKLSKVIIFINTSFDVKLSIEVKLNLSMLINHWNKDKNPKTLKVQTNNM